jgi:glutathione S-transferase
MVRLHCFAQSGNAFKVAFMLRALGVPWESVFVDFMNGATRQAKWRDEVNQMGEVPVLEDGERRLSQSGVILTYLAEKHGQYGGRDLDERLEVLRWMLFDNHKFTSAFSTYRFMKAFAPGEPDAGLMAWLKSRLDSSFKIVDQHLATRAYLVGDALSIADFSLSGYLFYPLAESGYDIHAFANVAAWVERLKGVPGWADPYSVMPGERIEPRR